MTLSISCNDDNELEAQADTFLKVLSCSPESGSTLEGTEIIEAELEYNVAPDILDREGFGIIMWFENGSGEVFSGGNAFYYLSTRSGTISMDNSSFYAFLKNDSEVEMYFELVQFTSEKGYSSLLESERFTYYLE